MKKIICLFIVILMLFSGCSFDGIKTNHKQSWSSMLKSQPQQMKATQERLKSAFKRLEKK